MLCRANATVAARDHPAPVYRKGQLTAQMNGPLPSCGLKINCLDDRRDRCLQSRLNTNAPSMKIAPGFRNAQCVDHEDHRREYCKRSRDLRHGGACKRDEGRHHATQGEANVPGQSRAARTQRGRKSLVRHTPATVSNDFRKSPKAPVR
jgi:hypothetical protein